MNKLFLSVRNQSLLVFVIFLVLILGYAMRTVEQREEARVNEIFSEVMRAQLDFQGRWLKQQIQLRERYLSTLVELTPDTASSAQKKRTLSPYFSELAFTSIDLSASAQDPESLDPFESVGESLRTRVETLRHQSNLEDGISWTDFYSRGGQQFTDLVLIRALEPSKFLLIVGRVSAASLLNHDKNLLDSEYAPESVLLDGAFQAAAFSGLQLSGFSFEEIGAKLREMRAHSEYPSVHMLNEGGYLFSCIEFEDMPWRILSFIPEQQLLAQIEDKTLNTLLIIGFAVGLVALLMYFLRRIVMFNRLSETNMELAKANQDAKMFQQAIETSRNLVAIVDAHGRAEYLNIHFQEKTGFSLEDFNDRENFAVLLGGKEFLDDCLEEIEESLESEGYWRGEYKALRKDGSNFWIRQIISLVYDKGSEGRLYSYSGRDITKSKEQQDEMERLAYYDPLTHIQNRTLFKEQITMALRSGERDGGQSALLYLDLDHFKRINDSQGHEAGDMLLIEVARRLKACLREEDPVGRLGGDEFGILLTRIGSPQYASIVANKVLAELSHPVNLMGKEVIVGSSIGITIAPHDGKDVDRLMKNADMAMYQAKDKGRNNFRFYTSDMNHFVESRMELEGDLREAINKQQFSLHYQPQVDLISGEIVGAEALIRWQHPTKGMISPLDFIGVAEETGLIVPIGKWVLRTAAQHARSIQKALKLNLKMSVNLSARQLTDGSFIETLAAVLEETRLDPSLLELEVTESMLMDNIDSVISQLSAIRNLGISLAIDDFGTGYSSLSYLKQLPVDILKIDRSFVKDLPDDVDDREITSLIITLAQKLDRKVIAEGVETEGQIEFLKNHGCDYGQGYYYSKPLPADEFMVLLYGWNKS